MSAWTNADRGLLIPGQSEDLYTESGHGTAGNCNVVPSHTGVECVGVVEDLEQPALQRVQRVPLGRLARVVVDAAPLLPALEPHLI